MQEKIGRHKSDTDLGSRPKLEKPVKREILRMNTRIPYLGCFVRWLLHSNHIVVIAAEVEAFAAGAHSWSKRVATIQVGARRLALRKSAGGRKRQKEK